MSTLQRTPLFPKYAEHPSVRCIDFGGWELPVQFSGIQREHEAVRQQAGLFDVSHMGELFVSGSAAFSFLQKMTTNDLSKLEDGKAQYSLLCYPHGGVVDDLLVYRLAEDRYMLVVNASNTDKVVQWVQDHAEKGVHIDNASSRTALLALQGPQALSIMTQATEAAVGNLKSFHFLSMSRCAAFGLSSRAQATRARMASSSISRRTMRPICGRSCCGSANRSGSFRQAWGPETRFASKRSCPCTARSCPSRLRRWKRGLAGA